MLEQILIPALVGLIGLIPVLIQLLANKGHQRSRTNELNRLQVELDFLEKWRNLSSHIPDHGSSEESARASEFINASLTSTLERYGALSENERKIETSRGIPSIEQISFLRRLFLLFMPRSATGWALHSLFYVVIIWAVAQIVSSLISPTYDPKTGQNDFVFLFFGTLGIFGIPAIVIQRFAIRNIKGKYNQNVELALE